MAKRQQRLDRREGPVQRGRLIGQLFERIAERLQIAEADLAERFLDKSEKTADFGSVGAARVRRQHGADLQSKISRTMRRLRGRALHHLAKPLFDPVAYDRKS